MLNFKPPLNGKNRHIKPKIKASIKLDKGPAKATLSWPHRWSLKLAGLIGTGLAQPNSGPRPIVIIKRDKGTIIEPKISICFNGFSDKRPACLAVESPKK